ncbi:hypothetical protein [Okeania sp. SIO2C2]|uniref:hypothetical protein n=1 Tax=Okeania sp. SIO2C2 TaxID=2607787 RepID=UPI00257CAC18|nr:hypothetical protein [Okeania sp. SIO2C2]
MWFWQNGSFSIYYLNKGKYEQVIRSKLLPLLDVELLASYVEYDEPFDAVLEFRQQIHTRRLITIDIPQANSFVSTAS